jgi:D-alanyl-D-alanine carboxypeptidase
LRVRGRHRRRRDLALLACLLAGAIALSLSQVPSALRLTTARAAAVRPQPSPSPPAFAYSLVWAERPAASELPVSALSGIVVDLDAGRVVWSRNPHTRLAPASLTKIMTAMVALELAPPERELQVPGTAVEVEPSVMGLSAGETVTVSDLLYGLLLDSGNDAAEALAQGLVPRPQFMRLMNARALRLRLQDTHFSNPTGLDAADHYSSAFDLAVMTAYFRSQHPELEAIVGARDRYIPATSGHKAFSPTNLNQLLWSYSGATGLKTGFTDEAGNCVVATALRQGRHLVAVVLRSRAAFSDAQVLLDYGFTPPAGVPSARAVGA